jgi:DNA-binding MarR family transcriptional regulator
VAKAGTARKLESGGSRPAAGKQLAAVEGSRALQLDRLIHERTRLAIASALAVNDALTFTELKQLLDVSDGNLSVHARKLEDAGYVECEKTFENRMPKTSYRLTPDGRAAFERYLNHMEALIEATREG